MQSLEGATILVTGSAGFVGFHTVKKLLDMGATVVGIDNFNTYYDPKLKEARNALLEVHKSFFLHRGDLSDEKFVQDVFARHSFDAVCHLAAQAGVRYSLENPGAYISSNIVAFTNLIELVRHTGVKNFVYASSSSVYGSNTKIPFSVEDRTDHPISLYAATKKSNELIAHTYNHLFGINTTGLRFFTVIGPYGRPDMAPMLFADAITASTPIKVFNHGKMQRDFTYVEDIVEGIVRALETPNGNRIFNLGNNTPVELEYFIGCLETSLGKVAVKEYLDMQPGDVVATYADTDLTTKELGWKPTTSIEESVRLFVDWYKDFYLAGGDLASQQK